MSCDHARAPLQLCPGWLLRTRGPRDAWLACTPCLQWPQTPNAWDSQTLQGAPRACRAIFTGCTLSELKSPTCPTVVPGVRAGALQRGTPEAPRGTPKAREASRDPEKALRDA
eukprot:5690896-Pyramimonas_sp.AAC.1